MQTSRKLLLGCTLAASLSLPFGAAAQDADTVVATVNGTDITLGHMIVLAERLPQQYSKLPDDQLYDGILEQLINQAALQGDAGELSARSELTLENEERALQANQVIEEAADAAVTDEALQEAYDAQYANAEAEQEFNASHILVESEDEAKAIVEELKDGADFAEVAKEKSTGPSAPKGGELGWFSEGMMVPEFEKAAMALEPGDISDPVKTQFGWHVIKLNDSRKKEAPTLDEVREELAGTIRKSAVEDRIAKATSDAEIERKSKDEIDPSAIRDSSLLD